MMRMKTRRNQIPHESGGFSTARGGVGNELELRPGGMLVQRRTEADTNLVPPAPPPTIRVQVKYGSINHQIHISSQATFGELKKMLTGPTGLHHKDQRLYYKDKERDSNAFLDTVGVKDKSKIVLVEDIIGKEKRLFEMKKIAKIERDKKLMSEISLEVDRLARQVVELESVITRGGKVVEGDILNLIELLMNQFLKLDGINIGDSDVKLQAKRVQNCVETLDMLKIKNSVWKSAEREVYSNKLVKQVSSQNIQQKSHANPSISTTVDQHKVMFSSRESFEQPLRHLDSGPAAVFTTQWVTFDSTPPQNPFAPECYMGFDLSWK